MDSLGSQEVDHFDVFVPVGPLVKEGVAHNKGWEKNGLCTSGNIKGAYGSRIQKVRSLYA
jgi:hypothetical protein